MPTQSASVASRIAAGLAGAALLVIGTIFTAGLNLVGAIGFGIAAWRQRRRGRAASELGTWIGAVGAVTVVCALAIAAVAVLSPPGSLRQLRSEASTASQRQPAPEPPAWLRRIAPRNPAAEAGTRAVTESSAFFWYIMVFTFAFMCVLVGAFGGSVGWGTVALLRFAWRGRVPPPAPEDDLLLDAAPVS